MSDYLCEELIDEILERLPPKSLLRFRSVSKSWDCRISSPNFIRKHAIRSVTTTTRKKIRIRLTSCSYQNMDVDRSVLTDEYTRRELEKFNESTHKVVGSCFGVICMTNYYNTSVNLWNPSVRRKLTVPGYPCRHYGVSFGFGFDPITDDYKIVGLCVHTSFVYSIKTNSWSEIQVPNTCRFSQVRSYDYGCFADGALHWVVRCETNNIDHYSITTFNLSTHVFDMISLPKPNCWSNKLTIIKDSLALISSDGHETWVWIRKQRNDNVTSWSNPSKLISLEVENCQGYNPFAGVHYAVEVDSYYDYMINMDICGETLELLDKETCLKQ